MVSNSAANAGDFRGFATGVDSRRAWIRDGREFATGVHRRWRVAAATVLNDLLPGTSVPALTRATSESHSRVKSSRSQTLQQGVAKVIAYEPGSERFLRWKK